MVEKGDLVLGRRQFTVAATPKVPKTYVYYGDYFHCLIVSAPESQVLKFYWTVKPVDKILN